MAIELVLDASVSLAWFLKETPEPLLLPRLEHAVHFFEEILQQLVRVPEHPGADAACLS